MLKTTVPVGTELEVVLPAKTGEEAQKNVKVVGAGTHEFEAPFVQYDWPPQVTTGLPEGIVLPESSG